MRVSDEYSDGALACVSQERDAISISSHGEEAHEIWSEAR